MGKIILKGDKMSIEILKIIGKYILILLVFIGAYKVYLYCHYEYIKAMSGKVDSRRKYDKDLLYDKNNGEPIFFVNPAYNTTMFFLDGFRGPVGGGINIDWFRELFNKYKINVVSPIIGLQGWPFEQRNREWHFQEDMRQALQIYDAYTALMPKRHNIFTVSVSFGALSNLTILAKAKKKPLTAVLISPLNSGLDFKTHGPIIRWLTKQLFWVRHIIPFSRPIVAPGRATMLDIVNRKKNLKLWERDIFTPEENANLGYEVQQSTIWLENNLIQQVRGMKILYIWGDDDLVFSQKGFRSLASKLQNAGNVIKTIVAEKSGHLLLFDNDEKNVKDSILKVLKNNFNQISLKRKSN